jgi:NADH:ubiquinone oxidoreductase subunit 6 (subunit J)
MRGKSTFGFSVKRGTPEYKRAKALTNNRNMTYAASALIVLLINLVCSIVNLLHLNELRYAHNLIFYGAVLIILMFVFMVLTIGRWQGRVAVELGRAQKELGKRKITK